MRLGVLDIGSNTVHMLVVDAVRGARPDPAASGRSVVRLMRYLQPDGSISAEGVDALLVAADKAAALAREYEVEESLALATSALREASNGAEVLAAIEERVGVPIEVLSGPEEARLTFLAARRWHGWASGRLMVLDIGGGSLEIASGLDEEPDVAVSVPLGAGRMTIEFLPDDPPSAKQVAALWAHVREVLAGALGEIKRLPRPDHVVATSKTFRSLARLAGMKVAVVGPEERWRMERSQLSDWVPRLARIPATGRTELPGITAERTYQIVAGGVVAEETMKALKVAEVEICPWALREGAILRRLDQI
ncbi:Ppx/GppA phosphatase family protein [Oerskovia sp. NPDC057915]|uniref:Ppx/GppA phosphatase family protein n=1 Tax=Oerskovia sp. NPDC057915 TaxID=3346280 RepID=UPI0036DF626B